ncbi:hypothetical protein QBC45DRAFT_413813, partial [Copromyces sp. CBS 386.78]
MCCRIPCLLEVLVAILVHWHLTRGALNPGGFLNVLLEAKKAEVVPGILVFVNLTTDGRAVAVNEINFGRQERPLPMKRLWASENIADDICVSC